VNSGRRAAQVAAAAAEVTDDMTGPVLPDAGAVAELSGAGAPVCGVRVVRVDGAALDLALPGSGGLPPGASGTLRWPAGPRGRYALPVTVAGRGDDLVTVEAAGPAEIEQHRQYVRGGGGEEALLRRPGRPDAPGRVRDISEKGVRAFFPDTDVREGDEVRVRVLLDGDVVDMAATVLKAHPVETGPMRLEVVAVFADDEWQAQIIRRYVLRQQLRERARG
jgi:PilZ domain